MPHPPNRLIEEAFLAPTVEISRRVEVYEHDGETPWKPEIWPEILIGGSVNVASDQDSRRSMDLELYNYQGVLTPEIGEFWYDKVIKAYYGIVTHQDANTRTPNVIIVEENLATNQAIVLKRLLSKAGIRFVDYNPLVATYNELIDYDIIISISGDYTRKLALLTQAYNAGKSVLTFGLNSTAAQLPLIITTTGSVRSSDPARHFENYEDNLDPVQTGWSEWNTVTPRIYRPILASPGSIISIEQQNTYSLGAIMRTDTDTGVWIHTQMADFNDEVFTEDVDRDEFVNYLASIIDRADTYDVTPIWESQIGEFIPESISDTEEVFSNSISVTARDYTKRCQASKLSKATMFTANQRIVDIIRALAQNSSITKMKLPETLTLTLGKDTTWERDQDRWAVMKEIAVANNCDLWFDAEGYLRLTPQNDPLLTPSTLQLTTGARGNLISRGRKTSDTSLFNHVTVIGESSDTTIPLVYGEAVNDNALSPSSTVNLGYRTKNISSPLVTTDQQAQDLAETMLSVSTLEEFELSFSSILFPWIEAGEILEMLDAGDANWGPARYLITALTLPLDLSPMTGSGKRVTKL